MTKITIDLSSIAMRSLKEKARAESRTPEAQAFHMLTNLLYDNPDIQQEILALTKRIEALEADYERRQGGK